MFKVFEYSHLGGSEILQVRYAHIDSAINEIIASISDVKKLKTSKERTKRGVQLYSPKDLNSRFDQAFRARGFVELRDRFTVTVPGHAYEVRGAYKQVDFSRESVLVEVQFGKYPFMFYDLAKFQYFFNESKAEVGVEIVPTHRMHTEMSSGVSYGEQLLWDIQRLRRHFPAVPVKVILIDVLPRPEKVVIVEEGLEESLKEQTDSEAEEASQMRKSRPRRRNRRGNTRRGGL